MVSAVQERAAGMGASYTKLGRFDGCILGGVSIGVWEGCVAIWSSPLSASLVNLQNYRGSGAFPRTWTQWFGETCIPTSFLGRRWFLDIGIHRDGE